MKRVIPIAISVMVVIMLAVVLTNQAGKSVKQEEITEAKEEGVIQKGFNFLVTTDEPFIGGATIPIYKMNEACRNERLEALWMNKFENDISDWPFMHRLYDQSYEYTNVSELDSLPYDKVRILGKALYCEDFTYENILDDIIQIGRDGEYNSTHILFALTIMQERTCYDVLKLDMHISEFVNELEIKQDEIGRQYDFKNICDSIFIIDLYAERTALIGYAGYPLKDSWIENISKCQLPNGSWVNNTHTTSLALWALIQSGESC